MKLQALQQSEQYADQHIANIVRHLFENIELFALASYHSPFITYNEGANT
ncbi:hypothetical protein LWHH1689_0221 [Limosilactobacillus reuteri]|uniref:Uncharacterized protein n=1 Tax=Limosilactobacillus reuteri TaxID=1598 RepID=A0A2S1ENN8_LIMRT|nr:hypothetical protein LWHH1689_0221 [Limosilactobacillus reuteri]